MAHRVGPFLQGDLGQLPADDGPGEGGAQQIALVAGAHLQGGDDHLVHHLVDQVRDDELTGPGLQGLFLQPIQLVGLAHVAGNGDDLGVVVILLQPGDDDGRIQAAGVGENDLLDSFFIHDGTSYGSGGYSPPVFQDMRHCKPKAGECQGIIE